MAKAKIAVTASTDLGDVIIDQDATVIGGQTQIIVHQVGLSASISMSRPSGEVGNFKKDWIILDAQKSSTGQLETPYMVLPTYEAAYASVRAAAKKPKYKKSTRSDKTIDQGDGTGVFAAKTIHQL